MRSVLIGLTAIAIVMTTTSRCAYASFAAVPLEILIDSADLVVEGKVIKIEEAGFMLGARRYEVAIVEVATTMKNITGKAKLTQVRIAQPAAGGIAFSTDIRFRPGQQGIWILNKDPQQNAFWAKHPFQFQQAKQKAKLTKLIASRAKLTGGKPVGGLVARAELVTMKAAAGVVQGAKRPQFYEVRFSLKNVSKKPIVISEYVGNRPLVVEWTGPGDKQDPNRSLSQHYAYLAAVRLAPESERNFVTIPPGGVRFLGPRGPYYGIGFSTAQRRNTNFVEPGRHKIVVRYVNRATGKVFGLKNVWTGEIVANAVELVVK